MREAETEVVEFGAAVTVEELPWPLVAPTGLPAWDAIVVSVAMAEAARTALALRHEHSPLVVALASARLSADGLRDQHADLVLSSDAPTRLIIATILALLRWRGS